MPAVKNPTVNEYIQQLPEDKKESILEVRKLILKYLPEGYVETVANGMLAYVIPLEVYPKTYNKQPMQYLALAAQKNYLSLHMVAVYMNPAFEKQLREGFASAGKKLDMGKGCVRFKNADDLDKKTISELISKLSPKDYILMYEEIRLLNKK